MKTFKNLLDEIVMRGEAMSADPAFQAHAQQIEQERQEAALVASRSFRVERGIPRAFWSALDEPQETDALVAVRNFLASDKLVLLLSGEVGRGKSVGAAWGVEQVGGRFVEAADIVAISYWDTVGKERLVAPALLVIDELGVEPLDQAGRGHAVLYGLLNRRMQSLRKTVLVTNLTPEGFLARYPDERLRDRLRAYSMTLITRGPSMRIKTGT